MWRSYPANDATEVPPDDGVRRRLDPGRPKWLCGLLVAVVVVGCGERDASMTGSRERLRSEPGSNRANGFFSPVRQIPFEHQNGARGEFLFPEIMGAGGGLLDSDGDGDLDLYAVQGGDVELAYRNAGRQPDGPGDRLLRNDLVVLPDGSIAARWVDVSDRALDGGSGRAGPEAKVSRRGASGYGMGVAVADFDLDGWLDIYVTNAGPNQLWRNRGDGSFEDVTERAAVGEERWSTSATFFDYDRDSWPDLFVANYVDFRLETHRDCRTASGALDYCGPLSYNPEPDRLYRNRGDGTFEDVTASAGLSRRRGNGLGVIAVDFDVDGWTDLFVANDQMANFLWRNASDGTFLEEAALAGCAVNSRGEEEASMGVAVADFDRDGEVDLFMTHLDGETHTLYRGEGEGLFSDRTAALGMAAPTLAATGFGTVPIDVDLDGWRDLYVANGAVYTIESLRNAGDLFPFRQADQLFVNRPGKGFEAISDAVDATSTETGRGVAAGDLARNGRVSLVVFNSGAPAWLLESRLSGRWLGVIPFAGDGGLAGAVVALDLEGVPAQRHRFHRDGSYASASDAAVIFGLGTATPLRLTIERPGRARLELRDPPQGRYLVLPSI